MGAICSICPLRGDLSHLYTYFLPMDQRESTADLSIPYAPDPRTLSSQLWTKETHLLELCVCI